MTYAVVDDSPYRCPRDHKRLVVEVGENERTGVTEMVHRCWTCGYSETDRQWKVPPVAPPRPGRTIADLLTSPRLG